MTRSTNRNAYDETADAQKVFAVNAAGTAPIGGFSSSASKTPTATPYAAGDVMGGVMTFASIGPAAGGEVLIINTSLQIAHTALVASEAGYALHLYSVTPPSALADNDPWDLPAGDRASYLGKLDLSTPVDLGSTLQIDVRDAKLQVTVPAGTLYGYLVTVAGITPTAAAPRKVTLKALGL